MLTNLENMWLGSRSFSIYDNTTEYTMLDLIGKLSTKINEIINSQNTLDSETKKSLQGMKDTLDYLLNQGVEIEVVKQLEKWKTDGTLDSIINKEIFTELNTELTNLTNKVNENITNVNNNISKLYSDSLTINVKDPVQLGVPGVVMDGVTDDSKAMQTILDKLNEIKGIHTIYIPSGQMLINSTLLVNFSRLNIMSNGAIVTDITGLTPLLQDISDVVTGYGQVYQTNTFVEGLILKGNGRKTGSRTDGVGINLDSGGVGSSRVDFIKCNIQDFGVGVQLGRNSYLNTFDKCQIGHCGKAVNIVSGANCGENYKFINSVIFNSNKGIIVDNEFCTLNIIGSSIDYCDDTLIEVKRGKCYISNSHIETDRTFYFNKQAPIILRNFTANTLNIDNSMIMFIEGDDNKKYPEFYFLNEMVNPWSGLRITNSTLQGLKSTSNFICGGSGKSLCTGSNTNDWDAQSSIFSESNSKIFDPHVFNLDPNVHKDIYLSTDNGTLGSVPNVFGDGKHGLKITKISDNSTDEKKILDIECVIPYDSWDKNLGGMVTCKTNGGTYNIDIALRGYVTDLSGNRFPVDIARQGNIEVSPTAQTFIPQGRNWKIERDGFNYVCLSISMFNAPQNAELWIRDVFVNTF